MFKNNFEKKNKRKYVLQYSERNAGTTHSLKSLFICTVMFWFCPDLNSTIGLTRRSGKERPKNTGRICEHHLTKALSFTFASNITTNLFQGGSAIKEVVFPNGISIAQVPSSSSW